MFIHLTLAVLLLAAGGPAADADAPARDVLDLALAGYERIVADGEIEAGSLLTVIDYSLPSTEERLFILEPGNGDVLRSSLVAHGKNSGQNLATSFSNENGSRQSSLGFFVTGGTYEGRHGYTLRLRGLEAGINDNAEARAIVIHGADYVTAEFIARYGRLGRSWGCPALPPASTHEIIDLIKDGSCVFIHGEDPSYLRNSAYAGQESH